MYKVRLQSVESRDLCQAWRTAPETPGVTGEHRRCAPAMSASRTGNSDWLQQISWPLIGPPVIPGATGAVRL